MSHMEALKRGDIIFMYANRVGVIGIGKAVGRCETLEPGYPGRLTDNEPGREWRIPMDWLIWVDEQHACAWRGPPSTTFTNVSTDVWTKRRDQVVKQLIGDSGVARELGL